MFVIFVFGIVKIDELTMCGTVLRWTFAAILIAGGFDITSLICGICDALKRPTAMPVVECDGLLQVWDLLRNRDLEMHPSLDMAATYTPGRLDA
jgi:hypothetical protein